MIAPRISEDIGRRIEDYCRPGSTEPRDLRSIASVLGALPLYNDAHGVIAIRRDGELICWRDRRGISVENDPRRRRLALVVGADRYPELRALVPERPDDALRCGACNGTGLPLSDESLDQVRCWRCSGLGWLDEPDSKTGVA